MDHLTTAIVSILTAVVGVAMLAVLVSKNANTSAVLTSGGSAFSSILNAAEAPVTSSGLNPLSNNNINVNSNLGF